MALPEHATASYWLLIAPEAFSSEGAVRLRELGLEVDEEALTVRAPFGPVGSMGSRVHVRNGRALYLLAAGSGTYRAIR
ncbi:MAG TPA: hypothetical protein VLC09_05055 [Polyangiaceae bacterium]|nr:hypothetical protein [Polyangiaceae bacterium]